jgi:hypothetical protein
MFHSAAQQGIVQFVTEHFSADGFRLDHQVGGGPPAVSPSRSVRVRGPPPVARSFRGTTSSKAKPITP